jgi:acetyltransferase-like isoleucine patch superfamily enzyme
MIRKKIKFFLLNFNKGIHLEGDSNINFSVINHGRDSLYKSKIINSKVSLNEMDEGCVIIDSKTYGNIYIGRFVTITGPGTVIKALNEKIQIGSFTSIGQNVCIVDFNHNFSRLSSSFINHLVYKESFVQDIVTKKTLLIEEDVFIGSNTVVLPGITIGRGSVIGAGSVVTSDIPRYSVARGNPIKVIKKRFSEEVIQILEELKWWNWDIETMNKNKNLFNADLNSLSINEIKKMIK